MLLEAGASPDEADDSDLCPVACLSAVAIQAFVNHGVVVRQIVSASGSTPLH
jgi:hypothetical protein